MMLDILNIQLIIMTVGQLWPWLWQLTTTSDSDISKSNSLKLYPVSSAVIVIEEWTSMAHSRSWGCGNTVTVSVTVQSPSPRHVRHVVTALDSCLTLQTSLLTVTVIYNLKQYIYSTNIIYCIHITCEINYMFVFVIVFVVHLKHLCTMCTV